MSRVVVAGGAGFLGAHLCRRLVERARFLLASTSEVYGDPVVHPQPEQYRGNVDPVGPRSVYDEASSGAWSPSSTVASPVPSTSATPTSARCSRSPGASSR